MNYHYNKGFDYAAGVLLRGEKTPEQIRQDISIFHPGEREAGIQAAVERFEALREEVQSLRDRLRAIGDYAHSHSSGPAVPDALWEVRAMAYEGCHHGE